MDVYHQRVLEAQKRPRTPIIRDLGNCVLSIILGSVFYNLLQSSASFFGRAALLFFTTLLNAFASGFEVSFPHFHAYAIC